jgi:transcriptional regulator with XRE-family HTH domain
VWLDNLKELRKEKGNPPFKKIAEETNLPERTIARIFAGDTNNPYVSTLDLIVKALGGSLDEIFSDTKVVVGNEKLATLQADLDIVKTESDILVAENTLLKDKVACLTAENDLLKRELEHKEEIINLHNFYNNALKMVQLKKGGTDV